MAICTVFHEESESEVKKCQILEPGGKKLEIKILEPGSYFPIFWQVFGDPRLGTDTPGPGEAVFAIRFIGKP